MTIHPPSIPGNLRVWSVGLVVMVLLMLAMFAVVQAKSYGNIEQQRIEKVFPQTDSVSAPDGPFNVRTVSAAGKVIGFVFQSLDVVDIPAYSGKPINTQVILDTAGVIQDAYVLEHHEPILLIGIPEEKLHGFTHAGYSLFIVMGCAYQGSFQGRRSSSKVQASRGWLCRYQ